MKITDGIGYHSMLVDHLLSTYSCIHSSTISPKRGINTYYPIDYHDIDFVRMTGVYQGMLYTGYIGLGCVGLFFMLGCVGHFVSALFIRRIYRGIKID